MIVNQCMSFIYKFGNISPLTKWIGLHTMRKALLLTFLGCCSIGAYASEQCQIVQKDFTYQKSKELTFKNQLAHKLTFNVPSPNKMIYDIGSPILIYNKNKYIGYQMIIEPFAGREEQADYLKNKWGFKCETPIIELTINNYKILILNSQGVNNKFKSVFIIPNTNDYFYLLSFKGFTEKEFNSIIATIKQGA